VLFRFENRQVFLPHLYIETEALKYLGVQKIHARTPSYQKPQ
jgi:hypothetical protein